MASLTVTTQITLYNTVSRCIKLTTKEIKGQYVPPELTIQRGVETVNTENNEEGEIYEQHNTV